MNATLIKNGLLFALLLAVPLVAEISTAKPGNVPGTGFDVLLYEPFDFAYVLLASVLFVSLNFAISYKSKKSLWVGFGLGLVRCNQCGRRETTPAIARISQSVQQCAAHLRLARHWQVISNVSI